LPISDLVHTIGTMKDLPLRSPWPYRLPRVSIGLLFIWAGAVKLFHHKTFAAAIAGYEILSDPLIGPAALGIPVVELIAGLGLLFDFAFGFGLTFGLLALFMGVLVYAMISGLDVDCGCFSVDEMAQRGSLQAAFFRDAALAASVVILFICRRVRTRSTLLNTIPDRSEM